MKGRMGVTLRGVLGIVLAGGLVIAPAAQAQQQGKPQEAAKPDDKSKGDKKKSDRALMKELATPYKNWLNQEVILIIDDDERAAFLRLNTNEEREQFIEQFWLRRDPTPDTVENEFKEEHYRRIAYANERFASGIPGWKTDRGRIYIMHGPPDEIESHPAGGSYNRPWEEGGGSTSVYPFEKWRYRYIEGIGNDVNLEFVDPSGSGEYRLTFDPSEKDALLYIPNAGLSDLESMGMASKTDRFQRFTRLPTVQGGVRESNSDFARIEQFYKIQKPPAVKFKDLDEMVNSRIVRNQIHFDYRFDFLRVTDDTVLVPITIQIPNKEMTFKNDDGVHSGVLNIYGRISTLTGRTAQTFEDVVNRDFPETLFQSSLKGFSIYQKSLPLRPGLYKLDLVVKDVNSGNVGTINTRMAVSPYEQNKLATSTLILADQIERVPAKQIGLGQFVLGASKVRPRMDVTFENDGQMGVFLQVYNLTIDQTTHKSQAEIEYRVVKDGQVIAKFNETTAQLENAGEQITLEKLIPLGTFAPGKYKIEIAVTDQISKQSVTPAAEFHVKVPEKVAAKTAANN